MAEDDVERLVADLAWSIEKRQRLARIVRELLAELPVGECERAEDISLGDHPCVNTHGVPFKSWTCQPCANRALRERLNRLARGKK